MAFAAAQDETQNAELFEQGARRVTVGAARRFEERTGLRRGQIVGRTIDENADKDAKEHGYKDEHRRTPDGYVARFLLYPFYCIIVS